jgi:hypothetical protein
MELVRTRILTGTCPECGTRLTGQERGQRADDPRAVDWVLVKQWCYNGCLSMTDGKVIPLQPTETSEHEPSRPAATHLIVRY